MSYVDTLSEADEFRAWEEGRLQGLKDAVISLDNTSMVSGFARLIRDMKKNVKLRMQAQQQFLDEAYGDDE
jgi:hypothetical protein